MYCVTLPHCKCSYSERADCKIRPSRVTDGQTATLTFMLGDVNVSMATFTVGSNGMNTVYLAIPAFQSRGEQQRAVYQSGGTVATALLSETGIDFKPGSTFSKTLNFGL